MKIEKLMTRDIEVIHPDTSLQQAASVMRRRDVGMLPVCDGQRLVGVLSDRDITIRSTAEGLEPAKTRTDQVMTKRVVCCSEAQDVQEAVKLMEQKQIRRLAIVNRDKNLVGVVSLGDVAVRYRNQKLAGEAIERVSEPVALHR